MQENWESSGALQAASDAVNSLLSERIERNLRGRALRVRAIIDIKAGRRVEVVGTLTSALKLLDSPDDALLAANVFRHLGDVYFAAGDPTRALGAFNRAADLYRNVNEVQHVGGGGEDELTREAAVRSFALVDALKAIAGVHARTGRSDLSIAVLEEILNEGRRSNDRRVQAEALSELALNYRRIGLLGNACTTYDEALELFELLGNASGKAHALSGLGMTAEHRRDFLAANQYYEQSIRLFQELGARQGQAKLLHCLGRVKMHSGDIAEAGKLYDQSLYMYRQIGHIAGTSMPLLDPAWLKIAEGNLESAALLCDEAAQILEQLDDRTGFAAVTADRGIIEVLRGRHAAALDLFRNASAILHEIAKADRSASVIDAKYFPSPCTRDVKEAWIDFFHIYDPGEQWKSMLTIDQIVTQIEGAQG